MENLIPSFDTILPVMRVHRWHEKGKRHTYLFVGEKEQIPTDVMEHIVRAEKNVAYWHDRLEKQGYGKRPDNSVSFLFATIWPDDRIVYTLTKILKHVRESGKEKLRDAIPFAWNKNGLLRFDWPMLEIDVSAIDPWDNPFPSVEKQPKYTPHHLVGTDDINIIMYEDLSKLSNKVIHMYFPDLAETKQLLSSKIIDSTEAYLTRVWTAKVPKIRETTAKVTGVVYKASFEPVGFRASLSDLFEKQEATKQTQLIQWVDDVTRVMYKLYKKHTIRANLLKKWMERYNIPEKPSLVLYEIWNKSSTFSKLYIQEDGMIELSYSIDPKDNIMNTIDEIQQHAIEKIAKIAKLLEVPITNAERVDISYDCTITVSTIGINTEGMMTRVNKELGEAVPILFPVSMGQETQKKVFFVKRASNLDYDFSLSEVVQSLLEYGVNATEIRTLLGGFGYTKQQLDSTWGELQFAIQQGKAIRLGIHPEKDNVPNISLNQKNGSFIISIKHSSNIEEAKRTLKWFASILFYAMNLLREEDIKYKEQIKREEEVKSEEEEEKKEEVSTEEEEVKSLTRTVSSESFEFDGGGNGFMLEKLQKADPTIFKNKKITYSTGCQKPAQPLVMTREEWDTSKTKVDNSILYRGNYYSCPTIWCKEAGIVMTEEEMNENKGLCPITGETPVILRSNPKMRFVGFNKNIIVENGKNIYSPCCFKTDQIKTFEKSETYDDLIVYNKKGEEVRIKKREQVGEEETVTGKKTYLFKKSEPVTKDRSGRVPMSLYRLFYPESAEQSANITTNPTIVRHGIGSYEDSLMESIAYMLDLEPEKKNKAGLIEKIIEILDPMTFISLEGGAVLASFVSHGISTITYNAWKEWIDQYPEYKTYMGLNDPSLKPDSEVIMREIKIYEAYLKFIHHLQSNDKKNTRILYNLLALYGVMLVIWERTKTDDDIHLSCPYFLGYDSLQKMMPNLRDRCIMLLYDETNQYQPLEIRTLNKAPIKTIPVHEYPMVQDAMTKCPISYVRDDFVVMEKVRALIYWTNRVFEFNAKHFMPKYIVLGSDLRIEGLITNNRLWIQLPRLSFEILPRFVNMLMVMNMKPLVRYHEDLDYRSFVSSVNPNQYDLFRHKCDLFGLRAFDKVPPPPPVVPIVSIMSEKYQREFDHIDIELRELRDVQLKIARYLLFNYREKVMPHVEKPRKEFIETMLTLILNDLWKKEGISPVSSKVRSKVKTAIEEMPLIYGIPALQKWIHTITLEPYHFYDSNLYTDKKAWSFSQLAVEVGLPKDVIIPSAAAMPKEDTIPQVDDLHPIQLGQQREAPLLEEIPLMAQESEITIDVMPVKWRKINLQLMKLKKYEPKYITNLFTWLSHKIYSPLTWKDVSDIKYIQIANIFQNLTKEEFKKALEPLFQEVTFRKIWITKLKQKKGIKDEILIDTMWSERTRLGDMLKEISEEDPSPLWPMYIDLQIMAQLMDIFILVVFTKPYTRGEKVSEIENLRLSSELYCNKYTNMERPLVILYREKVEDVIHYNLTLSGEKDEEKKYYYPSTSEAPMMIQTILSAHLEKRKGV